MFETMHAKGVAIHMLTEINPSAPEIRLSLLMCSTSPLLSFVNFTSTFLRNRDQKMFSYKLNFIGS